MINVEIITAWYNEEFLAPFFLKHYSFADKIHILLDADTNDKTLLEIEKAGNVNVEYVKYPDKFDDRMKIEKIMQVYKKIKHGWVFAVDSDEFLFPLPFETTMREALAKENHNDVIYAQMWQVYRHRSDKDLDPDLPPVLQRRHGDPNVSEGLNALYNKPVIVKAGLNIKWGAGCHHLHFLRPKNKILRLFAKFKRKPKISGNKFYGAHWAMADPLFCIERRRGRKARMSQNNLDRGHGSHYLEDTEDRIRQEVEIHLDDPQLF